MKRYLALSLLALATLGAGCATTLNPNTDSAATTADEVTSEDIVFADDAVEVVTSDAYGQDLDFIERYPGSIRSYYSSNEYETDVTYQTTASLEDIRNYFNDTLTTAGWTNSEEATDYMEYVRGNADNPEIFTVYFTEYSDQSVVEYELVYEPALSDEQIQNLDEEDFEF